nr:ribosome silencing factor [Adhaeretor mobilis]
MRSPIVETSSQSTPNPENGASERSLELAMAAARTAEDNRGEDIVILDMREITPVFDYFVLATGKSRRQLHAMSEEIDHKLEDDLKDKRMGIEGYSESRWILLDYGNVVIHLFDEETREFYALEDFWNGAKRVPFGDQSDVEEANDEGTTNDQA